MKRIITTLLLTFALVLSLSACAGSGSSAEEAQGREAFSGTWELSRADSGERTIESQNLEQMRQMGLEVFIELDADGTATLNLFESETTGTWTPKNATEATIELAAGERVPMTITDGVLSLEENGQTLEFTKKTDEASSSSAPSSSPTPAATLDIDPIVVVDDPALSIVIDSKATDRLGGVGFNATITNRSDAAIRVSVEEDSASVRGKMLELLGGQVIQPGKFAEVYFWFNGEQAGTSNPEMLVEVEGVFEVTNQDGSQVLGTYPFSF